MPKPLSMRNYSSVNQSIPCSLCQKNERLLLLLFIDSDRENNDNTRHTKMASMTINSFFAGDPPMKVVLPGCS